MSGNDRFQNILAQLSRQEAVFSNPEDKFWAQYLADADKHDIHLAESCKGDTDGILIFTGLFATTVATFAVQSLALLSPDTGEATVTLLSQIAQFQGLASAGQPSSPSSPTDFQPSASSVRINVFWFMSLFVSLCCALAATLVQQWCRRYLADTQQRCPPRKRGPIHVYLVMGIERFGLTAVVDTIITLLHIAVFLFFAGAIDLLFSINNVVAWSIVGVACTTAIVYLTLSLLPLIHY
ncbi:hypothetical protein K488DRAFT_61891, partial [Vararia minispora EC-137]